MTHTRAYTFKDLRCWEALFIKGLILYQQQYTDIIHNSPDDHYSKPIELVNDQGSRRENRNSYRCEPNMKFGYVNPWNIGD